MTRALLLGVATAIHRVSTLYKQGRFTLTTSRVVPKVMFHLKSGAIRTLLLSLYGGSIISSSSYHAARRSKRYRKFCTSSSVLILLRFYIPDTVIWSCKRNRSRFALYSIVWQSAGVQLCTKIRPYERIISHLSS